MSTGGIGTGRGSGLEPMALAYALLDASDPMDLGAWKTLLAEDVHVRIANRPVAVGLPKSVAELHWLFARTLALGRGFRELWPSPDGETVLMEVDLIPLCVQRIVPLVIVARRIGTEPILREVRFYFDPAPLNRRRSMS